MRKISTQEHLRKLAFLFMGFLLLGDNSQEESKFKKLNFEVILLYSKNYTFFTITSKLSMRLKS